MSEEIRRDVPLEYSTESEQNTIVGFWIFLAAEIALFTTYAVLFGRTAEALTAAEYLNRALFSS